MHTGAAAEAERCDSVEGFAEGIDAFGEEPMGDRQRERPGVLVGQFDSEPEERAASVADVVDDDTWRSGQVVGKYFKPGESAGGGVSVFERLHDGAGCPFVGLFDGASVGNHDHRMVGEESCISETLDACALRDMGQLPSDVAVGIGDHDVQVFHQVEGDAKLKPVTDVVPSVVAGKREVGHEPLSPNAVAPQDSVGGQHVAETIEVHDCSFDSQVLHLLCREHEFDVAFSGGVAAALEHLAEGRICVGRLDASNAWSECRDRCHVLLSCHIDYINEVQYCQYDK